MDFLKILRSLEEFLYEAMTWFVFVPRTLWWIVRHPRRTCVYVAKELGQASDRSFDDAISPPLLLMFCVLIAHGIQLGLHTANPDETGLLSHAIFDSEQNLLMYRSAAFAVWPLVAAVHLLHRQRKQIARETLRLPFFTQCYLTAPFAVVLSAGFGLITVPREDTVVGGLALVALAGLWYVGVQAYWFREELRLGWLRAFAHTAWVLLLGLAINAGLAWLLIV